MPVPCCARACVRVCVCARVHPWGLCMLSILVYFSVHFHAMCLCAPMVGGS